MDDRSTSMYPPNLLTFLLGSLAGASLALLFAPQSGRATRHSVSRRVRDGVDAARDLGQRVSRRGRELARETERTIEGVAERAELRAERLERGSGLHPSDTTL